MILKEIARPFFNFIFKMKAKTKHSTIKRHCKISRETTLEGYNTIFSSNIVSSKIGKGTYVQENCFLPHSLIGRFCSIGRNVKVVFYSHPTDLVSTYPGFYKTISKPPLIFNNSYSYDERLKTHNGFAAEIGNDCWVGNNVLIKGGVTISDGAIVAMGSIVTKDVPPYAIVGGNPAKIIGYRFENEIIQKLLNIKWWGWENDTIKHRSEFFYDVDIFLKKY